MPSGNGTNGTSENSQSVDVTQSSIDTFLRDAAEQHGWHETLRAYHLAVAYHAGVRRKRGEPFVSHPLYAARLLYDLRVRDDHTLAAALLHDVVEDCGDRVSLRDLRDIHGFSEQTVEIVSVITKLKGQSDEEYYARVLGNESAVLVKLADRYHNLTTMIGAFSDEKTRVYVGETRRYINPLAEKALTRYPLHASVIGILQQHILEYAACASWGLQRQAKIANNRRRTRAPRYDTALQAMRRASASLFSLLP